MKLETLLSISKSGLYAFINDFDKRIYISHGNSILNALNRNLEALKLKSHSCIDLQNDFNENKLELVILETDVDYHINRFILVERYKQEYLAKGYGLYKQKPAIKFRIDIRLETKGEGKYRVVAYLKAQKFTIPVGVFTYKNDCDNFVSKFYPDPNPTKIVIANNLETIILLKEKYRDVFGRIRFDVG